MMQLRLLSNGTWETPPVLSAARKILMDALAKEERQVRLGDLASFVNGTSYEPSLLTQRGTPIIRISNISDPYAPFLYTTEIFDDKFMVERGDLLVSWSASFKSIIWRGPRGVLNQHIFKVSENHNTHRGFLRHAIEAAFAAMQQKVVGIGMMHLRRGDFLGHEVPVPDYESQVEIARFLDWIESRDGQSEPPLPPNLAQQQRIVARIEELAAKIEEARELRWLAAEEANHLTTTFITGTLNTVPFDGRLNDVLLEKPRNGWSARCDNADGGTAVLSLGAVTGFRYRPTEFKRTSESVSPFAHYWLRDRDLLITRSNTPELVGHAAIYNGFPEPCIYPDLMMKLEIDESRADKEFVHSVLQSAQVREYIGRSAKGTSPTMKKISQRTVMDIPYPSSISISHQRRIVAELDDLQTKADALTRQQAETTAELDTLLPAILDRAFKGEL